MRSGNTLQISGSVGAGPLPDAIRMACDELEATLAANGLAFRDVPVTSLTNRLLPWTRFGFAVMVATGLLLFYATPLTYYHSLFFRIKVVLLVIAGVNVFVFHARTHRSVHTWDGATQLPRGARAAAIVSLVAWAGVIVSGRLIAYNWFECDLQPQPAFVNWVESCAASKP